MLQEAFEPYGKVQHVKVIRDKGGEQPALVRSRERNTAPGGPERTDVSRAGFLALGCIGFAGLARLELARLAEDQG